MKIGENDQVEVKVVDGNIIIVPVKKYISLKDRVKDYKGDYKCSEWDTGESLGNEI
jgi:antitoxin MazE